MSIAELLAVVAAPPTPLESGGAAQWQRVQRQLGLALPADLQEFGQRYGSGRIRGQALTLEIFNPFSPNYVRAIQEECTRLREAREAGFDLPYDIYPAPGGLLPWGLDDNGGSMLWLTIGAPAAWLVVLHSTDGRCEQWTLSMTSFLAQALANQIQCILWPRPFGPRDRQFTPRPAQS